MQEESENWLYFSHGIELKRGERRKGRENKTPQEKYDRWVNVLRTLEEKTDKNIIIWDVNESGGYWPLISTETDNMLERIHQYSHPDNKIWYVNGDAHAESNYNDWYNLVKPKMRINMSPLVPSIAVDIFTKRLKEIPKDHPLNGNFMPKHKKYRVICMVNQPKISRLFTLRELAGLQGFIYSFNCTETGSIQSDGSSSNDNFNEKLNRLGKFKSWVWKENGNAIEIRGGVKDKGNVADRIYRVDIAVAFNMSNGEFDQSKRINFRTPFEGLKDDNDAYHDFLPVQEWLDSSMELINETYQVKAFGLSDKTCKVLGFCKPFLVIGCAGWYKTFRKLGFELYDELFDYSFDEIESFRDRHKHIMNQIKDILSMEENKFNSKIDSLNDKLEFNKRHLLEYRDKTDWGETSQMDTMIFEMARKIDERLAVSNS